MPSMLDFIRLEILLVDRGLTVFVPIAGLPGIIGESKCEPDAWPSIGMITTQFEVNAGLILLGRTMHFRSHQH